MSDDSSSLLEEERSLFRPFTRESLQAIEARIADELEKQKELEKRRAEGEVSRHDEAAFFDFICLLEQTKKLNFNWNFISDSLINMMNISTFHHEQQQQQQQNHFT